VNALATRIVLTMIAVLLIAGSAYAETTLWDESQGSPLPFTWNITNFNGFNVGGVGTENLTVLQIDLNTVQRTIDKGNLTYSTTAHAKKLNAVIALNLKDNQEMIDKGLEQAMPGMAFDNGEYHILNWQAEQYVTINRKVNKLAKLVMEQGLSEKKTMLIGETWDIGDGWELYVNAIDAKAEPKQVWISLYKNGIKKDDKVVTVGGEYSNPIYTYTEKNLVGEIDVPLIVTYVDNIFAGETSDIVQFGGTWVLSDSVNVIQAGNIFGRFTVDMAGMNTLSLSNSFSTATLSPNTTINLIGNIKFKVINDTNYLKFSPSDEPVLNISADQSSIPAGTPLSVLFTITSGGSPVSGADVSLSGAAIGRGITDMNGRVNINITSAYEGNITARAEKVGFTSATTIMHAYGLPTSSIASWALEENYVLNLTNIDARASPKQARFQLSRKGILVKDSVVTQGGAIEYCPGNCTISATVDVIFNGTQGIVVRLSNATQYSEVNGIPLMTGVVHLFRSGDFTGINWLLEEDYDMKMMDIDHRSYPRLAWFELVKNGTVIDDAFLSTGERYSYNTSSGSTILTALVDAIFKSDINSVVKLSQVNQYSETSGAVLLDNATHSYISGEITRADQPLFEGYTLSVLGIDPYGYLRMTWLRLYKNDIMVDEKILAQDEIYRYGNPSGTILYAENSIIFSGRPLSAVQFRNVTQHSEINGSELISGATYIIVVNGSLFPIPSPTITPIPDYGRPYEVRGTAASEMAGDGALNLSTPPIIWTPQNFAGFYYDLNFNLGKEEFQILQPDLSGNQRTIAKGNLVYRTSAQPKMLNVVKYRFGDDASAAALSGLKGTGPGQTFEAGNYYIAGWQGEKYVALNGKVDKLARLMIEQGTSSSEKKTIVVGETWDIGDNWTITVQSVDARSFPRMAWLMLGRDGVKKEDIFLSSGTPDARPVYTYIERNISNESDVPVFVTYLDSVFAGATTDMVQFRYTWLISTSINEIKSSDTYGLFKDASVSGRTLSLQNSDTSITLSRDTTIDLMDNLKFQVADNDTLRFMPVAMRISDPGSSEIRGAVWNETPINGFGGTGRTAEWNAHNFAGFWYDLDTDSFSESLKITELLGRVIPDKTMNYNISGIRIPYVVTKQKGLIPEQTDGTYIAAGWGGDKQVAIKGKINKLSKIILEHGTKASEKKTLTVGESWELGGGYTLTAASIDANATPRQVWLTLNRNGVNIDDRILSSGYPDSDPLYTYVEKSIAGEIDVPLLITYVDSIFAGAITDMVQLRYTWLASENVTVINEGDSFGELSVTDITPQSVMLKNNGSIYLSANSKISLLGNLNFEVADSPDIRFYPGKVFPQLPIPISRPSVYFETPWIALSQNSSRSNNLILDSASNGLAGYNITISLSNASVASFGSIDFPEWAALHSNGSLPSSSVWIKAVDLNHQIDNSPTNVILANVTVRGDNPGYTSVTITIGQMDDDSGTVINPQTLESYIEVNAVKKFPNISAYPGDPDGDGLYEDINGNGRKDFNDVVLFFDHLEWTMDNEPVESFDFNYNGRIDFADIIELYEEI
jgi:S-layer protein (TIGR01567 family)